jgi:hypothetical protein
MTGYHYFVLGCLGCCLAVCLNHAIRLIRLGKPADFSPPKGDTGPGVAYSFTGAMHPLKKESAFLHLPTYTAGILYHLGTFFSLAMFLLILSNIAIPPVARYTSGALLTVSFIFGTFLLIKRFIKPGLRRLSNPDDYLSNILVTLFQATTALTLLYTPFIPAYYILTGLLLLYLPLGKLRHAVYFFAARYHLGFFFGWRGVWPPKHI